MSEHALSVSHAYDDVAERYADFAGTAFDGQPLPKAMVDAFAELVLADGGGPVLDAGCGPGHVTAHLMRRRVDAWGMDLSSKMVELARCRHPRLRFEVGALEEMDVPDDSLAGLVSHYSIIHTPAERLPLVLEGFARALAPGGHLLVSFQSHENPAAEVEAFDHQVTRAYRYGIDQVLEVLARVGVSEVARLVLAPELDTRRGFAQAHLMLRKQGWV